MSNDKLISELTIIFPSCDKYSELWTDHYILDIGFEKHRNYLNGRKDIITRSRDSHFQYRNSLQAALWNVRTLKQILVPGESAWEFEAIGNERSKLISQPFYMVIENAPISYLNAVDKGRFNRPVVDFINNSGVSFYPQKMPVSKK